MEATLSETDINSILRGISIPPQPQILADLQLAQAFEPPDMNEISKLICRDISMAGSILKVANSPFYGLTNPVTDIDQAILLLGSDVVINIVNGVALRQELIDGSKLKEDDIVFLNRFWDSAEDTAKAAHLVSEQLQLEDPNSVYLLGLFHNAGIPLLMHAYSDYRDVLAQGYAEADHNLTRAEDQCYNTNHAVLGYYLARSWKMPMNIAEAITEHHNYRNIFKDETKVGGPHANMLAILKLAEHLSGLYHLLGRHDLDLEWQSSETTILNYLNLNHDDIDELSHICHEYGIGLQNPT